MTGNGVVETYTASLEFFGPLSNPNTLIDWDVAIAGNAVNEEFVTSGDTVGTIGYPNSNIQRTWVTLNTSGNKLISADILLENYDGYSTLPNYYTTKVEIGSKGDSLSEDYNATGATFLSVSNSISGVWREVRAPELSVGSGISAMTLLVCCLLIWHGKHRQIRTSCARRLTATS
jgi:hypothetical protein